MVNLERGDQKEHLGIQDLEDLKDQRARMGLMGRQDLMAVEDLEGH
jgi:hypothetical protein